MLNLFKMDMRRLFRGKTLYIMMIVLTSIVLSSVILSDSSANLSELLGGMQIDDPEMAFIGGTMGVGAIYGLIGIIAMLFICNDYSSGFAKNIFSVHTNKRDYIISKLLIMMVACGILIGLFVLETVVCAAILGRSLTVDSVFGTVMFLFQKWLFSGVFAAIYIFINLWTRNKAVGTIAAFIIGTGGLVLGFSLFFEMIGIDASIIIDSTIHGASGLINIGFNALTTLRVLITGAVWIIVYGFLSKKVLLKKDVV